VGLDPLDFRLRNHVGPEGQPGERVTPADEAIDTQPVEGGVPFSSNGLRECLERGASAIGWGDRQRPQDPIDGSLKRGVGMGMFIYRGGPGGRSTARMTLGRDGAIDLLAGVMDVGEGALTAIVQIAAETLGIEYEQVGATFGDTALTPPAPPTAGSTATFSTGLAARDAAVQLRQQILETAARLLGAETSDLDLSGRSVALAANPDRRVSLAEVGEAAGGLEVEASVAPGSKDYIVNSFGAHFAEVEVDTETGQVRVLKYVAAHDSGRILNPNLAINQVEGGVSQMLGFTLYEQMLTDPRGGATLNASFLEHKSPTTLDYPDIQVIFADVVDPVGPFGLKALGEPPSIGVAPAIANAIYHATGVRVRDLPATPDRILDAIEALDLDGSQ
jgi:CO/xanthine dehydrogenase Mo-binding subunit